MSLYIALLRAVNVGGTGKIAMADLRSCLAELGFPDAKTILQSGNVIFDSRRTTAVNLEEKLEAALEKQFKFRNEVIVRSADQWVELTSQNPMETEALCDPAHLLLVLGKYPIASSGIDALQAVIVAKGGREKVRMHSGAAYIFFPDGIGTSRVTTKVIERAFGASVTARNWNTVLKIRDAM